MFPFLSLTYEGRVGHAFRGENGTFLHSAWHLLFRMVPLVQKRRRGRDEREEGEGMRGRREGDEKEGGRDKGEAEKGDWD